MPGRRDPGSGLTRSGPTVPGPLDGLTVVEVGTHRAGAFAGAILADLGADVVTVEDPGGAAEPGGGAGGPGQAGFDRLAFDRGKRSVGVDLGQSTGREILVRLVGRCDVLLDELSPAALAELGIAGTAAAGATGPVHCTISAFGPEPAADTPVVDAVSEDLVVQALSGNMDLTGEAGGPPFELGIPLGDLGAGVYAVLGILGAVAGSTAGPGGGAGRRVEVAKLDVAVALLSYMGVGYFADGESPTRVGTGHSTIFPYNAFRARDGEVVVAPFTQRFWRNFATATGRANLLEVDTYRNFGRRLREKDRLLAIFEPIMVEKTVAEWVEIFAAADVPSGPVLTVAGALELAQTVERGLTPSFTGADGQLTRTAGSPFRFRYTDGRSYLPVPTRPPLPGEHTAEPLAEPVPVAVSEPGPGAPTVPATPPAVASARARRRSTSSPLDGVRVLDLTRMFAGPCASAVLADLGAEVIKVEEPRIGDPTRRNLPLWGQESAYFMSLNRGKRSVALDLKSEAGLRAVRDLVAAADVLVENFRPGVTERLGLDHATLAERHPRLVYCSLSGFGATGRLRDKISFDLVNQAMSGMIDLTGDPADRPVRIGVPVGDMAGGLYLAAAALAGLRARDRTGMGSWVDLSLHDVLISLLGGVAQRYLSTGECPTRTGSRDRDLAPKGCYRAADGWLVLSAVTDEQWRALTEVLDLPDAAGDDRFADARRRKVNEPALDALLAIRLGERPVGEWTAALTAAGVPAAPVNALRTALESPLVAERAIVFDAVHPTVGPVRNLASPLVLDGRRAGVGDTSPVLGADTESVLGELEPSKEKSSRWN